VPTADDAVAVVERAAAPVTAVAAVSPLTKPVMESVRVGKAAPKTLLRLLAVTVSAALVTVRVPATNLKL
jgi:hypothetical protein